MYKKINSIFENIDYVELPGMLAHTIMAPKFDDIVYRNMKAPENVRKSSVLLPIFCRDEIVNILFTLRSKALKNHSGQISFPGGRIEKAETALEATLRETNEEIGISADKIKILGRISDLYVEPSNSLISTYIGEIKYPFNITINEDEVESIIEVPLNYFLDKNNIKQQKRMLDGREIDIPFWDIGADVPLWGATAMILSEFVELISKSF